VYVDFKFASVLNVFFQTLPEGSWYCPYCICTFCMAVARGSGNLLSCKQCGRRCKYASVLLLLLFILNSLYSVIQFYLSAYLCICLHESLQIIRIVHGKITWTCWDQFHFHSAGRIAKRLWLCFRLWMNILYYFQCQICLP